MGTFFKHIMFGNLGNRTFGTNRKRCVSKNPAHPFNKVLKILGMVPISTRKYEMFFLLIWDQ